MIAFEYGNPSADTVLIQMVGDHDLVSMEKEFAAIREKSTEDFRLVAIKADRWNQDLSPWSSPGVFGKEGFGDGAARTLSEVLHYCGDASKTYYIGGYSLAGLFALWAAHQVNLFKGVAAASPSIWFPGFLDYMKGHECKSGVVYLSLGDKEERTNDPVVAAVGAKIREAHDWLREQGKVCVLEWNRGNHFKEAEFRTAKAFLWVMGQRT